MKYLLLCLVLVSGVAEARNEKEVYAFRSAHACPSTGRYHGACRGYIVDHIIPLCGGGLDNRTNMQWQGREESYEKDRRERAYCVCIRNPAKVCIKP